MDEREDAAGQYRLVSGCIDAAGAALRDGNVGETISALKAGLEEAYLLRLLSPGPRQSFEAGPDYVRMHGVDVLG